MDALLPPGWHSHDRGRLVDWSFRIHRHIPEGCGSTLENRLVFPCEYPHEKQDVVASIQRTPTSRARAPEVQRFGDAGGVSVVEALRAEPREQPVSDCLAERCLFGRLHHDRHHPSCKERLAVNERGCTIVARCSPATCASSQESIRVGSHLANISLALRCGRPIGQRRHCDRLLPG